MRGVHGSSFNSLGLVIGMALKLYWNVPKGLKLTVRKFWGLIFTFVKVTGQKLVGLMINRVNIS